MLKTILATTILATGLASASSAATLKDVDLMFVIDSSGSMRNEGQTLSARIGEVMAGIAADSRINSVQAGVVSYVGGPTLEQGITGNVGSLQTAIDGISYGGGIENGLGAMASVLNGGTLFGSAGWRANTVRSIVLLTDEDADDENSFAGSYAGFGATLDNLGYLNNVIVSNLSSKCPEFSGTSTVKGSQGCEYLQTSRPAGTSSQFDLVGFTQNTDAFLASFISTKIGEIVVTPPTDPSPVPLPAAGWGLLAGLGALSAMRRKQKSKAA